MDDNEDYQAIFFAECAELLVDLQEQLDRLLGGDGDMETVNAAFRAVHSVKGGAAAFGLNDLIEFAHVFETVMDQVRTETLELTEPVCALLVRAGDILNMLVEHSRDGGELSRDRVQRVLGELREMGGLDAPEEVEPAAASPEPVAEDAADALPEMHSFEVDLRLAPDFLFTGNDPLKLLRALKSFGLATTTFTGDIERPEVLDIHAGGFSWRLSFESEQPFSALAGFFDVYGDTVHATEVVDESAQVAESSPVESETETKTEAGGEAGAEASEAVPELDPPTIAAASAAAPESSVKKSKPVSAAPGGDETTPAARPKTMKSLRVELPRIDRLVNLVGEIVITQAVMAQKISEIDTHGNLELDHAVESMTRQTRELQESVMAIRAQPVKSVFQRMPRVVRDLADTLGKDARLELSGEHTEVDTTVIEELAEPLTHMLRNSMDHGLEDNDEREALGKPRVGTIRLSAEHRGERVIIAIEDDGRGINREKVLGKAIERGVVSAEDELSPEDIDNLIFAAGFSTATEVSSVSGRGVGMDVVKKKIQVLGGRCALHNTPGKGLRFTITLPLTLAVLDGMTVCVGDERFILPLSAVVEALRVNQSEIEGLPNGARVMNLRGEYLPLISLRDALMVDSGECLEDMAIVVDTETGGQIALLVDELIGQRQVVLKSLEANFKRVEGVSGATILGDGRVALILDVPSLLSLGGARPSHIASEMLQ